MRIPSSQTFLTLLVTQGLAMLAVPVATAFEPGSLEFFEQKIRPVLIEHCYECHSEDADQVGGSLWLDSAEMMRDGGDSGPAIEPGDAEASVLISALRYESSEMPPEGKLADDVIDDFVRWINAGATDPRSGPVSARQKPMSIDLKEGRKFWAFRPLEGIKQPDSAIPTHRSVAERIDHQIRATLDSEGVVPNGPAAPEQRLRRLAFDLTGLPPGEDVRRRWLDSPTDEIWESIVDELMDSRAFAQHWARHWMDVARYADSNGSDFNATYHDAWRYRDYLIDSFDQDRPLDQLIRQHVAGDLLPAESDRERHDNLVATTFLMLGPKMLSERDKPKLVMDVVDDQIDTLGRAFLGLTLGCARCHDHKFDPIPMQDYYALAGIFKSTQSLNGESQQYVSDFNRVKLPISVSDQQKIDDYRESKTRLERRLEAAKKQLQKAERERTAGYLVDDVDAEKTGTWVESTYTKGFIGKGYSHDDNANKGNCSITFRRRLPKSGEYIVRFAYNTSGNRAAKVPVTIETAEGEEQLVVSQNKSLASPPWKTLGTYRFDQNQDAVVSLTNRGTSGYVIADAVEFVSVDEVSSEDNQQAERRIASAKHKVKEVEQQLQELNAAKPPPPPVAMAPADRPADQIEDCPLHIRGEVYNLGEVVPRGFLQVCSPGDATIESPQGSGRLELAHWLTDPDNPLVARVLINRLWAKVFGEGIVRTVDNFGQRGERPSHPALLDDLAIELMRNGWRAKPIIRQMVLSNTYIRSSAYDQQNALADPENRWLWRAHRKRIPAEAIRDSMLVAAGRLTEEEPTAPVADKGVLVTKNNASTKEVVSGIDQPVRTVYLPVIRNNIDPLLRSLDIADPDLLVGRRPVTNVPGQTLVLLNSEHVNAWAKQTADRIAADHQDWDDQISAAYERCLSRKITLADRDAIEHYIDPTLGPDTSDQRQRLRDVVAAIFASTEFRLLD